MSETGISYASATEHTMSFGKANAYGALAGIPIALVLLTPYLLIWGNNLIPFEFDLLYAMIVLITGIVIHELLHGFAWALYAKTGVKSIKFGMKWKYLTPYCHCREPLRVKHYRIGAAMPMIALGLIPSAIAMITGNGPMFLFGLVFTIAAAGDVIALITLYKFDGNDWVLDHPDEVGFISYSAE